jgi:hypothetical protein
MPEFIIDAWDKKSLPRLTAKQQKFTNALLEGKTAAEAYRAAYNSSNMKARTVWAEASRLRANPKVAAWLEHFQRIGMQTARVTIESHLAVLARTREEAIASGRIAAAVQAEHYRAKAAGLFENRRDLTNQMSDAELLRTTQSVFGSEIATAIGAALKGT